jgi:hypothetical protein
MKMVRRKEREGRIVQMEMLRARSKDRKCVVISLAQFAKRKFVFSFAEKTGSPKQLNEAIGVNPSMHPLASLFTMPEFNEGGIAGIQYDLKPDMTL